MNKITQCIICGQKYRTKSTKDLLIYGCRYCHKGNWQKNNKELLKIERKKSWKKRK